MGSTSLESMMQAARCGYDAFQRARNRFTPKHFGYAERGDLGWSWWTGHEAARTGQSLEAVYDTLKLRKEGRHG